MAGGGRTRQPRLGVVDAFDLDRQRQLVLVRRDNVEHLLMIGGPNDIVIETSIVRGQPGVALPGGREKESGSTLPLAPMGTGLQQPPLFNATAPGAPGIPTPSQAPSFEAQMSNASDVDQAGRSEPSLSSRDLRPEQAPPQPPMPAPSRAPSIDAGQVERQQSRPDSATGPKSVPPSPSEILQQAVSRSAAQPVRTPAFPPRPASSAPIAAPPSASAPIDSAPTPTSGEPSGTATPPAAPATRPAFAAFRPTPGAAPRPLSTGPRPASTTPLSRGTSAASLRRDPPPPATPVGPVDAADMPNAPATQPNPPPVPRAPQAPEPVQVAPPTPQPAPAPAVLPPAPSGPVAVPPVAMEQPRQAPLPTTLDTLESLEEEMAKLLGRPSNQSDKG
ncbi:flagellar biosynthetic protein FliO [Lichenihabitans sp. PAMC28606]|nr:flagellar biosynthetic protein FliO [Lichenihabitans sp. PAMC28606]